MRRDAMHSLPVIPPGNLHDRPFGEVLIVVQGAAASNNAESDLRSVN